MHQELTVAQIQAQAREQARTGPLGVVVVDYLQLVAADRSLPRQEQVDSVARGLKLLAKSWPCPSSPPRSSTAAPSSARTSPRAAASSTAGGSASAVGAPAADGMSSAVGVAGADGVSATISAESRFSRVLW